MSRTKEGIESSCEYYFRGLLDMMPYSRVGQLLSCLTVFTTLANASFLNYTISTVGTIPGTPDLENLAVRHTGDILVTSVQSNILHQLNPKNGTSTPVVQIDNATSILGIAEIQKDIFTIFASDYNTGEPPYTNTVWQINMTTFSSKPNTSALVIPITTVPSAALLNGMAALSPSILLGADSSAGNIYRIDLVSGRSSIASNSSTLTPIAPPSGLGIGVNGLKYSPPYLYYTSLDQAIFGRLPLSPSGYATGPAEVVVSNITGSTDDFTISKDGKRAWIAINGLQDGRHILYEVDIEAQKAGIVANNTLLEATSSVALIPGEEGKGLYITGARDVGNGTTVGAVLKAEVGC